MKYLLLLLLASIIAVTNAFAQPGLFDNSFGNKGVVVTPLNFMGNPNSAGSVEDVVQQPDGMLLTTGHVFNAGVNDVMVARYTSAGLLDSSFGTNGVAYAGLNGAGARSINLQPSGKILVGANTYPVPTSVLAAIRFNGNGTLDAGFGNGGLAWIPKTTLNNPLNALVIKALTLPGGKIIVAFHVSYSSQSRYALLCLTDAGAVDLSYGTNGVVFFNHSSSGNLEDIVAQPDGKAVLIYSFAGTTEIHRRNLNGSLDNSFGSNGKLSFDFGGPYSGKNSLALQPSGKILVAAGSAYSGATYISLAIIRRLNPDGSYDNSFGNNSIATVPVVPSAHLELSNISVGADGKFLLAGSNFHDTSMIMVRLLADGAVDQNFGKKGVVKSNLPGGMEVCKTSLLQYDGKIILAGDFKNRPVLARYLTDQPYRYNEINAEVFYDLNGDGVKNGSDYYTHIAPILLIRPGVDTSLWQNHSGKYTIDVDTGTYVTSAISNLNYFIVNPPKDTSIFTTYFNTDYVPFGLVPIAGKRDLWIKLQSARAARLGDSVYYQLSYANIGTDTPTNVVVTMTKDPRLNFHYAQPSPSSTVGNTITFNIGTLYPFTQGSTIFIACTVAPPPVTNVNDTLFLFADISPTATDLVPSNNVSSIKQWVKSSLDPNDKTESHAGRMYMDQYQQGEYLEYMIRFQNTGNDTAFNIHISDTLDTKLDWSSFEMIGASHDYKLQFREGRVKFTFSNVLLPDSNVNEAKSHGFIVYRVKPKTGLPAGTVFRNKADIYFDYNEPVTTNTEITELMAQSLPIKLLAFEARRDVNGNLLQWFTAHETNTSRFEIERSSNGVEYTRIGNVAAGLNSYSFSDVEPSTGRNYYRLKIIDEDGKFSYSGVRVVDNNKDFVVAVYPNPVVDKAMIQISSAKAVPVQVAVINAAGIIVRQQEFSLEAGTNLKAVNMTGLANGLYYLKISAAGNSPSLHKIIKQ